jgi:hypothetical protein
MVRKIVTIRNGWLLSMVLPVLLAGCGGGGGSEGLGLDLSGLGNPGGGGPLDIKLDASRQSFTVERGESLSFTVNARLINQGDTSQGLTVKAECPSGSRCEVSPSHFRTGGIARVTVYTTEQLALGPNTIKITGEERHYGALGGLGPLAVGSRSISVSLQVKAQPTAISSSRQLAGHIALGDIDGDGDTDLVATRSGGGFHVYTHETDGNLRYAGHVLPTVELGDISLANMDADGFADVIASAPAEGSIYVLLADGEADQWLAQRLPLADVPTSLAVADYSGDGINDIATLGIATGRIMLLVSMNGSRFESPVYLSADPACPPASGCDHAPRR